MTGLPLRNQAPPSKTLEPNDRVTTVTSTVGVIPNYGKSLLNSTSTSAKTYTLENPIPGVRKVLVQTTTSTTGTYAINGRTTTVLFATTANNTTITFDALGDLIELEGRTTLIWDVIVNTGTALS